MHLRAHPVALEDHRLPARPLLHQDLIEADEITQHLELDLQSGMGEALDDDVEVLSVERVGRVEGMQDLHLREDEEQLLDISVLVHAEQLGVHLRSARVQVAQVQVRVPDEVERVVAEF